MISPADAIACSFNRLAPVFLQPAIRFLDWSRLDRRVRIVRQPSQQKVMLCLGVGNCHFGPVNRVCEVNDHLVKKGPKPLSLSRWFCQAMRYADHADVPVRRNRNEPLVMPVTVARPTTVTPVPPASVTTLVAL